MITKSTSTTPLRPRKKITQIYSLFNADDLSFHRHDPFFQMSLFLSYSTIDERMSYTFWGSDFGLGIRVPIKRMKKYGNWFFPSEGEGGRGEEGVCVNQVCYKYGLLLRLTMVKKLYIPQVSYGKAPYAKLLVLINITDVE